MLEGTSSRRLVPSEGGVRFGDRGHEETEGRSKPTGGHESAGGGGVGGGAHYYNRVVDQVKEIDRINLFLSNHKDCNVTEWKYKVPSWINRNCRRMSEEEKKNEEEGEEETMTTEEEEEYGEGESVRPIRYDFSDKINRVW